MCSTSSSRSSRRTFPGTPATRLPGGMSAFSGTSAPAAMSDPAPMRAPLRMVAPIPTRTSSSTVQPCRTAPWPTETPVPTWTGNPASVWTTTLSWRLLRAPIRMASQSARRTAPYQTLTSSPSSTSATRTTPGAVQAVSWTTGLCPSSVMCNERLLWSCADAVAARQGQSARPGTGAAAHRTSRPWLSSVPPPQYCADVPTQPYGTVTPRPGKAVRLLTLHHGPGFVLPNAWDAGSARIREALGFPAIATTSSGIAWSHGLPDGESLDRETMLEDIAGIVELPGVPGGEDLGAGYGLPIAWAAGSARILEGLGFPAIATTGSGIAWSHGLPDGESLGRETMLEHIAGIVEMVGVPVSADLEAGYGPSPDDVARTVSGAAGVGAVGANLEDVRDGELLDLEHAVERVAAARSVAPHGTFVLNARTDTYLLGTGEDVFAATVERAQRFVAAGADCVFVPGVVEEETIRRLAAEIPAPLNVVAGLASTTDAPTLFSLGVK